jgi:hypothetical protein
MLKKGIIPNIQFSFRPKNSTIHQIHRLTDSIVSALEKNQYCTALFLDIKQAFDRVWYEGLIYKLKKISILYFLYSNHT